MGSSESNSCCSTGAGDGKSACCKSRWCGLIFKLVLVGLLACIATSLWEIKTAIRSVALETKSTGH